MNEVEGNAAWRRPRDSNETRSVVCHFRLDGGATGMSEGGWSGQLERQMMPQRN